MVFAEEWARPMLVVHALVGLALVAATTHLALWLRRFPRGDFARIAAVRRFSRIAALLYVAAFALGNLIYPAYKTRVRAEHFDEGAALSRDWENRQRSRSSVMDRYSSTRRLYRGMPRTALPSSEAQPQPANLGYKVVKVTRWFDVKEHWVALGLILSLILAIIVHNWNPKRDQAAIASLVLGLAVAVALVTWAGAIIGLAVSSYRAIGPLG